MVAVKSPSYTPVAHTQLNGSCEVYLYERVARAVYDGRLVDVLMLSMNTSRFLIGILGAPVLPSSAEPAVEYPLSKIPVQDASSPAGIPLRPITQKGLEALCKDLGERQNFPVSLHPQSALYTIDDVPVREASLPGQTPVGSSTKSSGPTASRQAGKSG